MNLTTINMLVPIIGSLGIGASLSTFLSNRGLRKATLQDRIYSEKREAYLGLLKTLHEAGITPSTMIPEDMSIWQAKCRLLDSKEYTHWQAQCQLFGSKEVSKSIQLIISKKNNKEEYDVAFENLLFYMRKELQN